MIDYVHVVAFQRMASPVTSYYLFWIRRGVHGCCAAWDARVVVIVLVYFSFAKCLQPTWSIWEIDCIPMLSGLWGCCRSSWSQIGSIYGVFLSVWLLSSLKFFKIVFYFIPIITASSCHHWSCTRLSNLALADLCPSQWLIRKQVFLLVGLFLIQYVKLDWLHLAWVILTKTSISHFLIPLLHPQIIVSLIQVWFLLICFLGWRWKFCWWLVHWFLVFYCCQICVLLVAETVLWREFDDGLLGCSDLFRRYFEFIASIWWLYNESWFRFRCSIEVGRIFGVIGFLVGFYVIWFQSNVLCALLLDWLNVLLAIYDLALIVLWYWRGTRCGCNRWCCQWNWWSYWVLWVFVFLCIFQDWIVPIFELIFPISICFIFGYLIWLRLFRLIVILFVASFWFFLIFRQSRWLILNFSYLLLLHAFDQSCFLAFP